MPVTDNYSDNRNAVSYRTSLALLAATSILSSGNNSFSVPKLEATTQSLPSSTKIYRYYASKTENIAPRAGIGYNGLSFSTKLECGEKVIVIAYSICKKNQYNCRFKY